MSNLFVNKFNKASLRHICLGFIPIISFALAECGQTIESGEPSRDYAELSADAGDQSIRARHICGASSERMDFCPTDFIRLAVDPLAADGKEVWIIGYLAVDGGQVVLFASEEDFLDMQHGRSIRLVGSREQLEGVVSEFGYKKVRLGGKFRANDYADPKNDRLGDLLPPVTGRIVLPRSEKEGVQDIRVDVLSRL